MVSRLRPRRYEAHANLGSDRADRLYVDREYEYTEVGSFTGCTHVRTANDDDKSGAVRFHVATRSLVTVLFDARARRLPPWLDGWPEEPAPVRTTDGDRKAYTRAFEAGEVRLGSNSRRRTGARSMYTVLVREAPREDEVEEDEEEAAAGKDEEASAGEGEEEEEKKKTEFPTTRALGADVGGGWRLIVSNEGRDKRLWSLKEARECAAAGMASWLPEERALAWCPRYRREEDRWRKWTGNPSSTVWRPFPRTSLAAGVRVRMRFYSERHDDLPKVDYSDRWRGEEHAPSLRNVAGTGDFRVGLLQTDGREDPGEWHAFQVRVYPYLHREARGYIGKNDSSNHSYWYRRDPGGSECLLDDYSQEDDRDGFKKLKHRGELKFGMGPHSPFGEFIDVEVELRAAGGRVHPRLRVHDDEVELDAYKHDTSDGFGREFTHVDAVCWSFNNMRPYAGIKLVCVDW